METSKRNVTSTFRLIGFCILVAALPGCARQRPPTQAVAAACFTGEGLEKALGPGVTPADGPAALILDSLVEPGGEKRHARISSGAMARSGYWTPAPGDSLAVVMSGTFPPVLYTLSHEEKGLRGSARPISGMPGAEGDTASWSVELNATACAPVLAVLQPRGPGGPTFPSEVSTRLVALGDSDQAARQGLTASSMADPAVMRRMAQGDSARTKRLQAIVDEWGWPSPSRAGESAAAGAFLVLQHSPSEDFQRRMLPVLDTLAMVGELSGQYVALLTDRVLKRRGLPQRYGSQFDLSGGTFSLYPIEDSANVDARRATLGLMPLAAYVDFVKQMYHVPSGR